MTDFMASSKTLVGRTHVSFVFYDNVGKDDSLVRLGPISDMW